MNALEFFQRSAGQWYSQRTTHHLAFRRAETGNSMITVEPLGAMDPKIQSICQFHRIDPALALGGAYITWRGTMEWDRTEAAHQGSSVFALVPDRHPEPESHAADSMGRVDQGRLLRDQGYGENMPVVGRYRIENGDRLVLTTNYETLSAEEQFWFASPRMRVRWSAVKRLGGFVTTSFCTETRTDSPVELESGGQGTDLGGQNPAYSGNSGDSGDPGDDSGKNPEESFPEPPLILGW
ncbi:MAG: phycobiliprotein lyase [Prochlorothrix sp.]|nr:phycobiliprotein lyase [Prochlorothrix sp.]